jgi:type IV secretion system protein VirB1
MIIPVALAVALRTCAPAAAPDTMAAIVAVESAGWPYAVNDNTARHSYRPRTRTEALRIAESAIRAHHSVDVGIAQVNSGNFAAFHVDAAAMLEPCANLRVGSAILANAYHAAVVRFPDRSQALAHALMAYNSGSIYAGAPYVRAVIAAATTSTPIVPSIALITSPTEGAAPMLPPAQIISASVRSTKHARPRPPDPRQATLRISGAWDDARRAGIVHNLDLQVDHGPQN